MAQQETSWLKTTFWAGLLAILPVAVLLIALSWGYSLISDTLAPLAKAIRLTPGSFFSNVVVFVALMIAVLLVGVLVRSEAGKAVFRSIEKNVFALVPGYSTTKEIISHFTEPRDVDRFAAVALARPFGNGTLVTSFIVDEHENGVTTVFVPTGPNPTSGMIYHVQPEDLFLIEASIQEALKTVVACGQGSAHLIGGQFPVQHD